MGRQKPTTNATSSIPRNSSSTNREKIAAYTASKLAKAIGSSVPGGNRVRMTAITRQAHKTMAKKNGEAMPATAAATKDTNDKDNIAPPRSGNHREDFFIWSRWFGRILERSLSIRPGAPGPRREGYLTAPLWQFPAFTSARNTTQICDGLATEGKVELSAICRRT